MKTKFSEWISQRVSSATRRGWLGLLLCGALELVAAVWIPAHWDTVTGTGWVPSWEDGRYDTQWVDGYWENQTIDGYWEDAWVDGHMESVWVDGYWDVSWTDGYWEENWVDGYWEEQWHDGYWAENWVDGYWDEDWNWNDGYWDWSWVDGYSDWNWVDGYSEWNWVDGFEDWSWVDGSWGEQWVDGYWDQNWVPPSEQTVWVDGYNVDVWVDGYWTVVWGEWSVDIWVEGHWEGEWTWTPHEVLGDWTWSAWSPGANTVLQGTTFTQARSGVRSRVTWETNEAGDVRNFFSGSDYITGTQQATGTKPFTWTAFDEPGEWYYSPWSPDPAGVPCGQMFTQTRTPHRDHRVGERNELGDERYVTTNTEDGQAETQQATGTQGCGGGGPTTYSLTVVNGTGGTNGLSPGATRTITATVPYGALFTGWEISGPGTIPVSRLAVIRTLTMGAGNVTATATYQFPGTQPIWFDVNDDGIRDEVAPRGALGFHYAIDDIWTTYEYESANWDIFFDWRDLWWPGGFTVDSFSNLWLNYRPSVITSATTWIASSAVFDGEVGEQYRIMGWNGGAGYWGDYASITLGAGDNLQPTIYLPSLHAEDFLAFKFVRARISKPLGFVSIGGVTTGALGTSMGTGGVIEILLPSGGAIINVSDLANKMIKAGPEIVWEVWDAINNIKIGNGTTTLGGILNTANIGITTGGEWYVGFKFGELPMAWITVRTPQPILEPITLDGGIPPYNASGLEVGTQRSLRLRFAPFSSVADSAVTWTATPGVSFVGGNNVGKTVVVQGDVPGISTLEVTIAGFGGPKPSVTTHVFGPTASAPFNKRVVKLFVYIVRNSVGGGAATTTSRINSMVAYANSVFRQAGLEFAIEGAIGYVDDTNLLEISKAADSISDYAEARVLGAKHNAVGPGGVGLELYFVDDIEDAAGLSIPVVLGTAAGIIIDNSALPKTLAHELGHACEWPDIYLDKPPVSLSNDKVKSTWLPGDWNSGPDAKYYDNITQRTLVQRLLMHGHGQSGLDDNAIVIPRGAVHGIPRSGSAVNLDVGLAMMNRDPKHP